MIRYSHSLLIGLALLAQGCAPWQPPSPTRAVLASRCGVNEPCPCGDSPGMGQCPAGRYRFIREGLRGAVVQMAPTHEAVEAPAPFADDAAAWDCKDSVFEGDQIWTCHKGLLHRCEKGKPVQIHCGRGCESMEMGEDDICSS